MPPRSHEGVTPLETPSSPEPKPEATPGTMEPSGETPPNSEPTPSQPSPTPTPGAQSPFEFEHPRLKGKSPKEVEKIFGLLEHTVREQGQELSRMHQPPPSPQPDVRPKGQPSGDPSNDDFWKNPTGTIKTMMHSMLDEAISPFKRDLAESTEARVIESLTATPGYEDLPDYLPVVRELARQQKADLTNVNVVKALYFMAIGASQKGMFGSPTSAPPTREASPMNPPASPPQPPAPPQHPASRQPLPPERRETQHRPLTETERRLARQYSMTDEEYLQWQEGDEMILEPSTRNQGK